MFPSYKTAGEIKCILLYGGYEAFKHFLQLCTLWRLSTQSSFVPTHSPPAILKQYFGICSVDLLPSPLQ